MAAEYLRQSTASQGIIVGPFLDDTNFVDEETALSIANTDVKIMMDGGASSNKNSGGGTHRVNGMYSLTLDATDTASVGRMDISISVSGALPVWKTLYVLEEATYDFLFADGATPVADINAEVDTALGDYDAPTKAEFDAAIGTPSDLGGGTATIAAMLEDMAGATFDNTTDSLEAIRNASSGSTVLDNGTATAGAASTITLAGTASTTADLYNGCVIAITGGTGAGQSNIISDYSTGRVATVVRAWATTPDATSVYEVTPFGGVTVTQAEINAQVDAALETYGLDHLVSAAVTGADVADNSIIAKLVSSSGTADWDTFVNTSDSLQAIRDQGDSAWITGSGTGLTPLASGTAQAGGATSIQLASGVSFADDELNYNVVKITSGTGAGQSRLIVDYDSGTKTATMYPAWTTSPDATSVYEIVDGLGSLVAFMLDTTSPANVANQYNGTGITGDNFPATQVDLASAQTDITDILADTADMQPKLGTPAGADMSADIAAVASDVTDILADTNELQTDDLPGLIAALNDITVAEILAATIETGVDLQTALQAIAAVAAGDASGMDTGTIIFKAIGNTGTTRVTSTGTADGNRSSTTVL